MAMKQLSIEEKELLLKDLCARLPYDVIVDYEGRTYYLNEINPACKEIGYITVLIQDEKRSLCAINVQIEEIKPYLRPLSSMTEEERIESLEFAWEDDYGRLASYNENILKYTDWLNAHHFDYRDLIEKGLAIEASTDIYNKK